MKYKVKRSTAGLGLFATEPIKKGEFVAEYTGELITSEEADRRGGKYLFVITDDLVLDAKGREHKARYMNHSCRPNCYAEVNEEEEYVKIYAKRKIAAGDELSYDYGKEYFRHYIKPYGCRCEKCWTKTQRKMRLSQLR